MCRTEIFNHILSVVENVTEINKDVILSNDKTTEVVDARYLLVYLLSKEGFYPSSISLMIHKSKRAVNYILSNFSYRLKTTKILRTQLENIKNILGNN